MSDITVSLPDGSSRALPEGSTAGDLAADIGPGLAKAALIAETNGTETDLNVPLNDGDTVSIVVADSEQGLFTIRHSTAHVLAQAVLELYPGATFAIGPPIEHGFYYDFDLPDGKTISDDDLEAIEAKMREIIAADQPFIRGETNAEEAAVLFADHPYKREIIEAADASEVDGDGVISFYRNSDTFVDLCRGPHVPSTGRLGHFKLMNVAGAYWRGDENKQMLQRIYGTAWATKKQLKQHLHRLEEAAKRDHRNLANELDLLSFPSELGGGLAVWHPKGAIVRKIMEDYNRDRHEKGGYEFVYTPHLAKSNLFETSGHLDFYADGMYPPMEMDNGTYYPKPMNCPMHCLIFRGGTRSYRDLPIRMYELGTVYRYERAGHTPRPPADPRIHAGRQPHLHDRGGHGGRVRQPARLLCVGAARLRVRGLHVQPVDSRSREVGRHRRNLGEGNCGAPRSARAPWARLPGQGGRRGVLRPEDRHRRP